MNSVCPLVTVVIPTFNRADLVRQTLESVKSQTYAHWEAIVVDDGSSDGTQEVLAEFQRQDPRIRFLRRERLPKGACTCRNIGLAAAQGEWIVFLDSDDLLAPTCLERRAQTVQKAGDLDFVVFQSLLFCEEREDLCLLMNTENGESDLIRFLRGDAVWHTSGPIWRKAAVENLGGFDEKLSCWQDIDIHLRALIQGLRRVKRLEEKADIFVRRHRKASISQDGFKTRETVASLFGVYEKTTSLLRASVDPEVRSSLRQMLAHGVQYALDGRYFDLARAGIAAGERDGLLSLPQRTIWQLAYLGYAAHSKGFRGCARLAKSLMEPFQPKILVGTHRQATH